MKATIFSVISLIGSTLAAPANLRRAEYDIGISLINDLTGRSAFIAVPSGGHRSPISVFDTTNIEQDGKILASSAQLLSVNIPGVYCQLLANGQVIQKLSATQTFADLDGTDKAAPIDISAWEVSCTAAPTQAVRRSEFDAVLQLSDDKSGKNSRSIVPVGYNASIKTHFQGTAVDVNGRIIASSAQLVAFLDKLVCSFSNGVQMNGREKTFADIDGQAGLDAVDVTDLTFRCDLH